MSPLTQRHRAARQAGLSLLELLVSLVIGGLVVGALLVTYLGSGVNARQMRAMARMTEDAQFALSLLARDIRLAGYAEAKGIAAGTGGQPGHFDRRETFRPVYGCKTGWAAAPSQPFAAGACGLVTGDGLEVNYQATIHTTDPTSQNLPSDCLGRTATAQPTGSDYYFTSNRYAVIQGANADEPPHLSCVSNGAGNRQPLVENVAQMNLTYGVASGWIRTAPATWRPVRYVPADQVAAGEWASDVVAVRICLVMRSADPVILEGESKQYIDCSGTAVDSPDRRLYRAYHATVAIRSKAGF